MQPSILNHVLCKYYDLPLPSIIKEYYEVIVNIKLTKT